MILIKELNIVSDLSFDLDLFLEQKSRYYNSFTIKSKNGKIRRINSPKTILASIQYQILSHLENKYFPLTCVQGYVKNKSIKTNAVLHVKKNLILNIDIKNFFNHITKIEIKNSLKGFFQLKDKELDLLVELLTLNDSLPQGAPTSPIISNIVCTDLDVIFSNIAKFNHCNYSRYGDDITFSTLSKYFPREIYIHNNKNLSDRMLKVFKDHNFIINKHKLKLANRKQHQEVTGITVNKKTNVDRKYIRNIRATLYNIQKNGFESEAQKWSIKYSNNKSKYHYMFKNSLLGKINYVGFIKGYQNKTYINLLNKFNDTFKINRIS